jgi:hypothetical protein
MKVLYGKPLSDDELKHFTQIVFTNVIMIIKALAAQVEKYGLKHEVSEDLLAAKPVLPCLESWIRASLPQGFRSRDILS